MDYATRTWATCGRLAPRPKEVSKMSPFSRVKITFVYSSVWSIGVGRITSIRWCSLGGHASIAVPRVYHCVLYNSVVRWKSSLGRSSVTSLDYDSPRDPCAGGKGRDQSTTDSRRGTAGWESSTVGLRTMWRSLEIKEKFKSVVVENQGWGLGSQLSLFQSSDVWMLYLIFPATLRWRGWLDHASTVTHMPHSPGPVYRSYLETQAQCPWSWLRD